MIAQIAAASFLVLAADQPVPRHSCATVRAYVAVWGVEAAEAHGKREGLTQVQIAEIKKRCAIKA